MPGATWAKEFARPDRNSAPKMTSPASGIAAPLSASGRRRPIPAVTAAAKGILAYACAGKDPTKSPMTSSTASQAEVGFAHRPESPVGPNSRVARRRRIAKDQCHLRFRFQLDGTRRVFGNEVNELTEDSAVLYEYPGPRETHSGVEQIHECRWPKLRYRHRGQQDRVLVDVV